MSKDFGYSDSKVDVLESKIRQIEFAYKELEAKNAKLRECVEFYADFRNFSNLTEYGTIYRTAVFSDMEEINEFTKYGGKRAREALSKIKREGL